MQQLLQLFEQHPHLAILISICISILVAMAGIIPSVFITAANILFFGLLEGTIISFAGEALGALVAFMLYRKGFKKTINNRLQKYPRIHKLLNAEGRDAFWLVFSCRLVPYIPSGLVTFAAAMGKIKTTTFFVSSSLGKIPALAIEAWSVYQLTQFGWQGKIILAIAGLAFVFLILNKFKTKQTT